MELPIRPPPFRSEFLAPRLIDFLLKILKANDIVLQDLFNERFITGMLNFVAMDVFTTVVLKQGQRQVTFKGFGQINHIQFLLW